MCPPPAAPALSAFILDSSLLGLNSMNGQNNAPELQLTESKQLYDEALRLIPGGSQTLSKRPQAFAMGLMPIYLERGQGCRVWDVDGNCYIDYIGALGPVTLGYCYPAVDQAVRAQLAKGCIFSMMHPLEVEAAREIVEAVPCAEMVRFLKTGAEATSAAVRIARAFTGRELVVSSGYHGWLDTWTAERTGTMARGVPAALRDSIAGFAFGKFDGLDSLEAVLNSRKGEVAAIIMEPVSYTDPDTGAYLRFVQELADRHRVVLIFDEIVSGFRVARGGAQELFGVTPDLACFAKGISNGLPVAAVVGTRRIMQVAADLIISSTYGGDALGLAAVVACLREYREKNVVEHLAATGKRLVGGLNAVAVENGLKLRFQGHPMMSTFAFGYETPEINDRMMTLLLGEMARRGVLLRRGGLIFISYSHGESEIEETISKSRIVFPLLREALESGNLEAQTSDKDSSVAFRVR